MNEPVPASKFQNVFASSFRDLLVGVKGQIIGSHGIWKEGLRRAQQDRVGPEQPCARQNDPDDSPLPERHLRSPNGEAQSRLAHLDQV